MSGTPRTDAAMCVLHPGVQPSTWYVQAAKCREIERDLAAARAELAENEGVIAVWRRRSTEAEDEVARLREALQELVRLKALKDKLDDPHRGRFYQKASEFQADLTDYRINKPRAWEAARAALAAKETKS